MPADDRQKPQPPRFMVSIAFMETDWCDMLVDEGGYEAVVGVFAMLARLKSRDRNESTHSGAFPSERSLEHALGPFAKHIPLYRKAGVLDGLRTPLWDWQTKYDNDPERQRRYRERMAEREGRDTGMDGDRNVTHDVTDDGQNPNPNPNPVLSKESPSGTRDTSKEDGWADWIPDHFRTAWYARGLREPPPPHLPIQASVVRPMSGAARRRSR